MIIVSAPVQLGLGLGLGLEKNIQAMISWIKRNQKTKTNKTFYNVLLGNVIF